MERKLKILTILGTRPEAIKLGPVISEIDRDDRFLSRICITSQHKALLGPFLELWGLSPDYDLDLMLPDQAPTQLAANALVKLDPVVREFQPDWLVIQGDTTSAAAAALAGYYCAVPVAHVEAGLRTADIWQPYPEEAHRKIISSIATLHLAPTETARSSLVRENVDPASIVVTGNPVIDAFRWAVKQPYDLDSSPLVDVPWSRRIVLVTAHRRENFGKPLRRILEAVGVLADRYSHDVQIVFPVHPNPNVRKPVYELLDNVPNISLTEPLDYLSMVNLLHRVTLIISDSGGLQEEAVEVGVPILVLRDKSERPEAIEIGVAQLVGTDPKSILEAAFDWLEGSRKFESVKSNPFGDGYSARRIAEALYQGWRSEVGTSPAGQKPTTTPAQSPETG
ncbi:MAG: UDP-N-acetylglucosamine 2-epimerase (non-hydrolyzing) [Anaerolineales bacterium]